MNVEFLIKIGNAYMSNNNMDNSRFNRNPRKYSAVADKEEKTPFQRILDEKLEKKNY